LWEERINSELYGFLKICKLTKLVRFVNKNIKMRTEIAENKGM